MMMTSLAMDGCAQAWAAVSIAQAKGVLHENLTRVPCLFHLLTKGLEESLGCVDVEPDVYSRIRNCLYDIATYYETTSEAKEALSCLVSWSRTVLPSARMQQLDNFIVRVQKSISQWGYFAVMLKMTLLERTSNRAEIENAIAKGRPGVTGMSTRNGVDKGIVFTGSNIIIP